MKKLVLLGLILSVLSGCGGDDNSGTPDGVIKKAAKALSKSDERQFLSLLTGPALEKFQTADQQQVLLNTLGPVKKIKLGQPRVVSTVGNSSDSTTLYDVDVMRGSQIIYQVASVCRRVESTSTHLHCPAPPQDHNRPDPWPGHNNGGGHSGGGHSGGGSSGGGITPGPSNPGGNGDPDRPPRFPGLMAEESFSRADGCYDVVSHYVDTTCKIKDVR